MIVNTSTATTSANTSTAVSAAGGKAAGGSAPTAASSSTAADTRGTADGTASAWAAGAPPGRVSWATAFGWLLRSEWGKLWSVRSTYWCVAIAIGLPIVVATGAAAYKGGGPTARLYTTFAEATGTAVMCSLLATIPVMVLGLMAVTSEYRAKAIHATLAAAPRRIRLLAAKTVIVAALGGLIGLAAAWTSFAILVLPFDLSGGLTDPTVLERLFGRGLHAMILATFALALGAVLRSTAAGITLMLVEQLITPLAGMLPGSAGKAAGYLPTQAGGRIQNITEAAQVSGAYQGLLVFALWAVGLLVLAGFRLRTQDA
jgi:ABC-2 type transport system permease protein